MFGAALAIPVGFMLGTASATASADSNWATCHYDESGAYLGATSKATGANFTPDQITQLGCETNV